MMFELVSDITIGRFKRVKVHDIKINHSVFDFVSRAVIKIPISARLKYKPESGVGTTSSLETAKLITEGMAVNIDLGYNGSLKSEFIGFVSRVNFTQPVEIECEGYSYLLRKKSFQKTFVNSTLGEVLKYLTDGTLVKLASGIPDMKITKLILNRHNGCEALDLLQKLFGNMLNIWFEGDTLVATIFPIQPRPERVKYRLGWNVIKDNNLKQREAKNSEVIVNYRGKDKAGNEIVATAGNKGEVKEITSHQITDHGTLKLMAEGVKSKISYDGYEGKITTFLQPFAAIAWQAALIDERYPERSGNYLIENIEVKYGTSGARRTVGIGMKL